MPVRAIRLALFAGLLLLPRLAAASVPRFVTGGYNPDVSADGRYVAFSTWARLEPADTNDLRDIYVYDRQTGAVVRASVASDGTQGQTADNADNRHPAISADGRHVAFESPFDTLVPDDTNGVTDMFVHDLDTGRTTRVSVGPGGVEGNDESDSHYPAPASRPTAGSSPLRAWPATSSPATPTARGTCSSATATPTGTVSSTSRAGRRRSV